MEGRMDRERSGNKRKASRKSLQSNATPGSLDEDISSARTNGNPVSPAPASGAGETEENPWSGVMRDLARLVVAAYEADPHRFD